MALLTAQIAAAATYRGLPALVPDMRHDFGISVAQAGLVVAAPAAGNALMLVLWGIYADRRGERWLLPFGMTGAAAGLVVAALSSQLAGVLVGLFVMGLFSAVAITSVHGASEWSTTDNRAAAVSLVMTGVPLGGSIAAVVLPVISGPATSSWAFAALAAVTAMSAVTMAIVLRRPPARPPEPALPAGSRSPFRDPEIWRMVVSASLVVTTSVALVAFLPLYFHEERDLGTVAAGGVLAGALLGSAAARVIAGHVADHVGRRLLPTYWLAALTVVLVAAMVAAVQISTALGVAAAILAVSISFAGNGLSATATAERAGPSRRAVALAFRKTLVFAAGVVGPIALGLLVAPVGWEGALALTMIPAAAGALVLRPLVRREASVRAV